MKIHERSRDLTKQQFERHLSALRPKIINAHFELRKHPSNVVIIVSGVEGAGKGEVVRILNEWLDPRGVSTTSFWLLTEDERRRPAYWRYSRALPARGRVGILFGSWYTDPIVSRVSGTIKNRRFGEQLESINRFEKMLALDGTVFLKLWFHIDKKTLKSRLKDIKDNPELHWHLLPKGRELTEQYDAYKKVCDEALAATDTPWAPWHVIDAEDDRSRDLAVARVLLSALQTGATAQSPARVEPINVPPIVASTGQLAKVDVSKKLTDAEYEEKIKKYRSQLLELSWKMFKCRRSLLAVFEGWDAAGKGGAIRRVTGALDPRLYHVIGYAAPNEEERAHHYLWRFWRNLPISGLTTIFDRSHYGRVLVERVEGFARPDEWSRAYDEINDFETQLTEGGFAVVKFWLHISQEEQLKRFKAREKVAYKNYKITEEDWRNRKKWPQYEHAVEDMLARTNTPQAPWHVIPAVDKRYARVAILRALCKHLETLLEK